MDRTKSLQLEKEIKGTELNGYKVISLINNGKSAAVFRATKDGKDFALKVFDNYLVERFGHEIQTKRIQQEIDLKNHTIPNLIKIFEGGNTDFDNQTYYYLVMEFILGVNLKDYILKKDYSFEFIKNVLLKLVTTTSKLLEEKNIAHRDIKPENIMVSNSGEIILMDLGVLKLVGAKSFSDEEEKSFVGTLRYAAPEFLLRTEEDSILGWKSLNIYQIGATLHDLVMKREIFSDKTPYSNLVIAIKDDMPEVYNDKYPFELLQLIRDMLVKDWKRRLTLIDNSRLKNLDSIKETFDNSFDEDADVLLKMTMGHKTKFEEIEKLRRTQQELKKKEKQIGEDLKNSVDLSFQKIREKGIYNSLKKSKNFRFNSDKRNPDALIQNYLYEVQGDLKSGFPRSLFVLVRISNDSSSYSEIEVFGIFPSVFLKADVKQPLRVFQELAKESQVGNRYATQANKYHSFQTFNIYRGVAEINDSFENHLSGQLLKLFVTALKRVEDYVKKEIQYYEDMANNKNTGSSRITTGMKNIIINKLGT
ncbi:hypothetical protein GCM10009117_13280 [Gangjinia marincola]|uniref:Protein kinase domain-containing protein n=1 Tax=Gangjinia marincola TaxID=578463 RepID=A0ABP3XW03_9FLAO